jgi:hypothetical protein
VPLAPYAEVYMPPTSSRSWARVPNAPWRKSALPRFREAHPRMRDAVPVKYLSMTTWSTPMASKICASV